MEDELTELIAHLTNKYVHTENPNVKEPVVHFNNMQIVRRSPRLAARQVDPLLAIEPSKKRIQTTPRHNPPAVQDLQEEALQFLHDNIMKDKYYASLLSKILSDQLKELMGPERYPQFMNDDLPDHIRVIALISIDASFYPEMDLLVLETSDTSFCPFETYKELTPNKLRLSASIMRMLRNRQSFNVSPSNPELQEECVEALHGVLRNRSILARFIADLLAKQLVDKLGKTRYQQLIDGTLPKALRIIPMLRINERNFPTINVIVKPASSTRSPFDQINGFTPSLLGSNTRIVHEIRQQNRIMPLRSLALEGP